MTEERKGELKTFGAKCKTFSAVRKQKEAEVQQPKELTIEEKVENIANNMTNLVNSHANAINAIAMWIEQNDAKVAKAGGVVQWAVKEQQKKQRLAERKSEYQRTRKK